ncbi:carboxypeptidase-like regulatory domain-containing protein [Flavobacterium sp. ZT3R18]|uniref:carboxypeptidase-like regulatory domain-containing protein n=1 Tax=Flavobacterium sp. ZT3R18 TaxID=2594429 RepID=UPI00163D50F2|nr:carboxypeptidase-like regulatory domain-containing protein [Flavobacterium sp. ZT3R18]
MKNNLIVLLVFLSQSPLLTAQEVVEKIIIGTVVSDSKPLEGISVVNCSNKLMAVSDKNGCFSILAKDKDVLNFSGIDYKYLRKYVYKHEYISGTLEVNMTFNSIELDEVIINKYANINAENFGIIPRGQVKFTPQERRLYAGSGGIQGFFNLVSGEKEVLKKNVEIEKKEILMKKLEYLFGNKYYTKTLKIPEELIKGFQYYCVEDAEFVESLGFKNKTVSMFLITNLASVYNKNRIDEK